MNRFRKTTEHCYIFFYNTSTLILGIFALIAPWIPASEQQLSVIPLPGKIGITLLGITFITVIINVFFTGKHFDKTWKNELLNNSLAKNLFFSLIMPSHYSLLPKAKRATIYASHIVLKNKSKKNGFSKQIFNGYDFRKNARLPDKFFSFLYATSLTGAFILFFVMALIKLFY